MTKLNQALLAAASSIALFGGALTLITPSANAEVLYSDPLGDGWGRPTYNNGAYTRLDDDDLGASSLFDSTVRDNAGNTYDCDSFGYCHSRW